MKTNRQRGFTLLESLITIALITLVSGTALLAVQPFFTVKQEAITEEKVDLIHQMLTNIYEDSAWTMDRRTRLNGTNGTSLDLYTIRALNMKGRKSAVEFTTHTKSTPDNDCSAIQANFLVPDSGPGSNGLKEYLPQKYSENFRTEAGVEKLKLFVDGYNNDICVFAIAHRNTEESGHGATIPYYEFVIASKGENGVFDTNFNVANLDAFEVAGDDVVKTLSGFPIQERRFKIMRERLIKVSKIYQDYYYMQYLKNPARDVSINYFSQACDTRTPAVRQTAAENPVRCSEGGDAYQQTGTDNSVRDLMVFPNGLNSPPVMDISTADYMSPYPDAIANGPGDAREVGVTMKVMNYNERSEGRGSRPDGSTFIFYKQVRTIEANDNTATMEMPAVMNYEPVVGPPYTAILHFTTPHSLMSQVVYGKLN